MPGSPYTVAGTVGAGTTGLTDLSNFRVTLRNEATNEILTVDTQTGGVYAFNLGNLTSGWTVGDIVTVVVIYQNYEAFISHTSTSGGGVSSLDLTLTAISATSLRYHSVQEVMNYTNLTPYETDQENGIKSQQVHSIAVGTEALIDNNTNTKFDNNGEAYYDQEGTYEYQDARDVKQMDWYLENTPVNSITSLEVNTNDEDTVASWKSLTETTDYEVDTETGRIRIPQEINRPAQGSQQVRIVYKWGHSSVPEDIKRLAILITSRTILKMNLMRAGIRGSQFTPGVIDTLDNEIKNLMDERRRLFMINT